jgi:hypothetical protein
MRIILTAIVLLMTLSTFAQQSLVAPQAITDPTKLESKTIADMQNFSIEKLYMTRAMGAAISGWLLRPAAGRRN